MWPVQYVRELYDVNKVLCQNFTVLVCLDIQNICGDPDCTKIDIIASDGDEIVFVEVRTRSKGWMMPPECTVGPEKLKKLKRAARIWTEKRNYTGFWRIDLIAVTLKDDKLSSIEHIKEITEGIE